MLLSLSLAALVAPLGSPLVAAPQDPRAEVKQQYEALCATRDAEALGELWEANRALILQTIDADLEGSLALWEQAPESPDQEKIAALHERALFGAEVASGVTGNPIFADYASSFIGWDASQKRSFRTGQALYRAALEAIEGEEWDLAHMKAMECRERALPLGDWWGTAMGYSAEGRALRGGGHLEEALVAHSLARLVYHDLGLFWNEYQDLRAMTALLRALERPARALIASTAALPMARALNDEAGELELLQTRLWAQRQLGRDEQAAATAAEIEALKK